MRTSNDVGSSRSDEDHASPMRNRQDDARSRSQRSVKSSRNDEEETRNIKYNDQQQAELLRKLDSIKDHLIRGGNAKDSEQGPQMGGGFYGHGPHGHGPTGPSYYNNPYPDQFAYGMYPNPGYRDPYGYGRHHGLIPGHHQMQPRPPQYPQAQGGQYVDIGADILDPHIQDPRFFPVTPSRYGDVPYSPQGGVHHKRRPTEVESEMGGGAFARGYVQKGAVPDFDTRRCHPLAGGAPFIACHSCFELLYLPKKKLFAQGKEHKLECGACAEVISFTIDDKKIVFASSPLAETTDRVSQDVNVTSVTTAVVVEACSIKDEETKVVVPSRSSDSEESSSISSEPRKEVVKSVRSRATKATPPPPPPDANLLTLFEYSNVHRAAMDYGMSQLGYDKEKPYGIQDSLKLPCYNQSVATEVEVSDNGYYNNTETTEVSRISTTSKEENKPTSRKRESSEYNSTEVHANRSDDQSNEQLEVWVNGHLIPEDLVISAEKQAGPVQAGNYWYDYRAGFWGVMGHPCLGIIPPFIEEFSHPMPDNCGAGNTSVFVNSRELHERDFELLSRRGLPREKNRSYIIDISGRVLDGDSGEELKSLGRLAPTIEKVKHGFGMRVPRSLAS